MSAHQSSQAFRNRRLLSGTTALLVVWSLSGSVYGQDLPTGGTGTVGAPTIPVPGPGATNMTVTLNAQDTVIDWATFNIAAGNEVHFDNNGTATAMSVLNRVAVGGGQSLIDGTLSSDKNIAVWLLNPNGVLFGSSSTVNTGSFFVSSLNMANTDFTSASYRLRDGINSAGAADATWVANGAITFGGTVTAGDLTNPASIGAAGQIITANGAMTAVGGDIALIATRDVTFDFTPGSPLGIEVGAGTTLATAKVTVGATGQLEANSIIMAGAANITDTLLGIDSGATLEAVEVDGRIILSVGVDAASATHASLDFTPSATTSAADIVSAGALTSGGDVILAAPGDISQTGNVTADADYRVTGAAITVGGTQGAKGTVVLDGTTLSGSGTLTANSDATGTEALELKATGTINMTTALNGGTARQSDVDIDAANQDVTLGNISAKALTGLNVQDGDISLGTVSVTDALTLRSMDGSLSVTGVTTDDGGAGSSNASLRADTTLSVNGPVSVDGDYTLRADTGAVTVGGTQGAKGRIEITGVGVTGSGSLTSDSDGTGVLDNLVLTSTDTINMTTALNGGTARQTDVDISAANQDVTLGNISAKDLTGLNAQDGDIALGTVSTTDSLTIRSTSGSVSLAGITTDDGGAGTSDASVRADTTVSVNGPVSVDGDYTLTSDTSTVTVGGTQGAKGLVTITGVGILGSGTLTSNSDATGTEALTLNSTGTINMTTALNGGTASQSNVAVSAASQDVTLGNVTAANLTGLNNQAGDIALGAVSVLGDLDLRSTSGSLSAAAVTADDGVSGGAVSDAFLRANTTLTISGNVSVEGDYAATADTSRVTLGGVQGANGKVTVQGATATFNALTLTANKNDTLSTGDAAGALSITATGGITLTGSATTLKGGTTATHFTDVTVDGAASGTGNVTIAGNVVELSNITTSGSIDIAAVDSIGGVIATAPDLKATGADTSVKAVAGTTLTVGDVEAGDGTGTTPPSPQIALEGTSVTADAVDARDGDADLHATDGDVTATSVEAKGSATVQADISTVLAANIRIDSVTTTDGDVALTANNGDITGKLSSARLSATAGGGGSTLTIAAPTGKANLGTLLAGSGTVVTGVTDQLSVTAEEIDITSARAHNGDVTLTTQVATGTSITVGSAEAQRHVDIDALTTASAGDLTSHVGDVTVAAVNTANVLGDVTAGDQTGATGNYNVTGSTIQLGANVGTQTQQARGLVRIHATGDIDSLGTLTLTADSNNSGQEPLLLESDAGKITFASTSLLRGGTARHSKVGIFLGDATQALTLGGIQARGLYELAGTGGAEAFLSDVTLSGDVTLGDTSLRNTLSITTTGTISALSKIVVSGTGQGLFLDGGDITANGDLAAQGNVDLTANTISATNIYSNRNIETSGNSLDADLVHALGDVTDTTLLGAVTAITAGTAAPAPYTADVDVDTGAGGGPVTGCCDATPAAPGLVAGSGDIILTKDAVDVGALIAARDLTATSTVGTVVIGSGTAGRDATVAAETSADIGTLEATSGNLGVTAGDTVSVTDGGIDVTTATAGQDVTLSARNGDIKVGTVTADRAVLIENTDRGGTTGDVEIATAVNASDNNSVDGNAIIKSQDDVRLAAVSAKRGNIEITAAADITGTATTGTPASIDDYGRGDVTSGVPGNAATADKTILVQTTGGRVKLGDVTAGDGAATASTGVTQITVTAQGVDLTSANARDGGVELTATDAGNDLSVGTVAAADDVDLESVRSVLTNDISSAAGDIRVTADNGDISGTGGLSTAAAMTASGESRSIIVSAVNGTARLGDVTAGSGSPSATVVADQVKVTAQVIDFDSAKAWAMDGGLTLEATSGDVTLGAGEARTTAAITASDNVRLGDLTAQEDDAIVQATSGDVTGQAATHASISAGNDVQVTSGGASQLDTLSAGRNVQIAATGDAEVIGDVTAGSTVSGGGYDVRGQSVTLGKATSGAVDQKATGLVRVAAASGDVTGLSDLTLTSDSDASTPHGAPVLLEAANGAVTFGANTTVQGGPDRTGRVGIHVGAGQAVALGTVNARAIDGLSGTVGSETFTAGLNTTGDISFGQISVRNGLSLATTAGNITTGGITVSGANQGARLTASGAGNDIGVSGDVSTQGDVVFDAGRDITLANVVSNAGNIDLNSGGDIFGGDLAAAGALAQTATGSVTVASLTSGVAGPDAADAGDSGAGAAAGAVGTLALPTGSTASTPAGDTAPLAANSHISVDADAITVGTAIAAQNLTLASRTDVRVDTATATNGAVLITADAGDVSGRTISPAGDGRLLDGFGRTQITAAGHGQTITVTATAGNLQTDTVTAGDGAGAATGNQVTMTAGKAIDTGDVEANDGNATLLAQDGGITATTVMARKNAKLTTQKVVASGADLVADDITTTDGKIELASAGALTGTSGGRMDLTAGGNGSIITATASGGARLGNVTAGSGTLSPKLAGNGVTITASDIDVEAVEALDGGVTLVATSSDITAQSVTGSTYADVSAQGSVTADLIAATGLQVDVEAITRDIVVSGISAGTGITLLADGSVRTNLANAAGGDISLIATNGDVSGLALSSAATDGRLLAGFERADLTASGGISVNGSDVQLGAVDAGAALTVMAGQSADVTDAVSVGASNIEAGQTAIVASVESTGSDVSVKGTTADVGTANAGGNLLVDAGDSATLGAGTAGGTGEVLAGLNATVGSLDASGNATITAGAMADVSSVSGADVTVTAGTDAEVDTANASGNLLVDATDNATLGAGTAGGTGEVLAGLNATVGSLDASGNAMITAGATADVASVSGADVTVTAGTDALVDLAAASGNLLINAGGSAVLGTGTAGGDGTVMAVGDATITTSLIADGSASLTAGNLASAAQIDSTSADVAVKGASVEVTQSAAATTLQLEATAGDLGLDTGTSGGAATLTVSDNIDVASLDAGGAVTVQAGQVAVLNSVSGTDISVTGDGVHVDTADAGGNLSMTATGIASLGTGTAGGNATVTAGDHAVISILDATGNTTVTAGLIADIGSVTGADIEVTAGSDAYVGDASASGNLRIDADGSALLGSGLALGTATVSADGDAIVGALDSGSDVTISAGSTAIVGWATGANVTVTAAIDAEVDTAGAAGNLLIDAGENVTLGLGLAFGKAEVKAGNDVTIFASLTADDSATVTAGTLATVAHVESAGASVAVKGASVDVTEAAAKTSLAVEATGGDLRLGTGVAGTAAALAATGNVDVTSLVAGASASVTAGQTARLASIQSTAGDVSVKGATTDVTTAGAGGDLALEATGGSVTLGTGTAGGTADVKATGDATIVTSLIAGGAASVNAGGMATAERIDSTGASVAIKGASVDVAQTAAKTTLAIDATSGDITLGTATSDGAATLTASGNADTASLKSGAAVTVMAGQTATVASVESTGSDVSIKGRTANVTTAIAGGKLALEATAGNATLGTGTATGAADVKATGDATVTTSLIAGGAATLNAGGIAKTARIESTGGSVAVKGASADVSQASAKTTLAVESTAGNALLGSGEAGTTADLKASGNATIQVFLRGGGTATVTAGGTVQAAEVRSTAGDVLVSGAGISMTTANAGGLLKLSASAGGITLGTGTAGGAATLETTGTSGDVAVTAGLTAKGVTVKSAGNAQLAAMTSTGDVSVMAANTIRTQGVSAGGQAVKLDAADADIAGDVTGKTISIAARRTLRLGSNAPGSGGFELSETEVNHLKASGSGSEVALDAGTHDVAIGDLNWTLADPGTTAAIFTTARVDLAGRLATDKSGTASGSTAARTVILGGSATDPAAQASVIRVAATAAAGGRIDVGGAMLDLRGGAIAVGQAEGFLDDLGVNSGATPLSPDTVAATFVNQPSSTLYRSRLPYSDPVLVRAGSLKLKYKTFALFQNTGQGPVNVGTNIGTAAVPGMIEIDPTSPPNAFALFGEINEVIGSASALLGQNVIRIGAGASIQNTRINGCVVGAATACLSSSLVQPPLTVFDNSSITILTAAAPDLSFDSVLSSNNESLFSDIAAPASSLSDDPNCDPTTGQCPAEKGTR